MSPDYRLKSYIEENYPDGTAQEIHADLSEAVVLDDDLTKSELATFFAFHPAANIRLRDFVANIPSQDSPLSSVWGVANMTLQILSIADIEINPIILDQGIAVLKSANLLTDAEYEALQPFITRLSNKGIQLLGYLPTVEQIQSALDLAWPQQS
jgi:hypothetical protein